MVNDKFLGHGLKPITLAAGLLDEVMHVTHKYTYRSDLARIACVSYWNRERAGGKQPEVSGYRKLKAGYWV